MNVSFQLAFADIVVPRSNARALYIDFLVLTQMSRMTDATHSHSARKALKAANDIMNTFQRESGDEEDDTVDKMVARCRSLAESVLGHSSLKPKFTKEAQIWGIGHW
jgi:hypothetical protein